MFPECDLETKVCRGKKAVADEAVSKLSTCSAALQKACRRQQARVSEFMDVMIAESEEFLGTGVLVPFVSLAVRSDNLANTNSMKDSETLLSA